MHDDGEVDTRGTYTVLAVARLLNMLTPELVNGVAEYLISCQTYEGVCGDDHYFVVFLMHCRMNIGIRWRALE